MLVAPAACAGHASSSNASSSPPASPAPLQSCETRTIAIDGVDVVVHANADQSVASIVVIDAPDPSVRERAYADAVHDFGTPSPDTRTQTHQFKDGLVEITDMCGRPVHPTATPSP
jgi:hypothetical protein